MEINHIGHINLEVPARLPNGDIVRHLGKSSLELRGQVQLELEFGRIELVSIQRVSKNPVRLVGARGALLRD